MMSIDKCLLYITVTNLIGNNQGEQENAICYGMPFSLIRPPTSVSFVRYSPAHDDGKEKKGFPTSSSQDLHLSYSGQLSGVTYDLSIPD